MKRLILSFLVLASSAFGAWQQDAHWKPHRTGYKKGLAANPQEPHLLHNATLLGRELHAGGGGPVAARSTDAVRVDQLPRADAQHAEAPLAETGAIFAPARSLVRGQALDVVFATGPGCERWDPETMKKGGLGGSETMLIHMARELAKLGHPLRIG